MIKVLAFLALVAGTFAIPVVPRIVNGTDAKEGEIPYIISLRSYGSHSCGGSILDATHVLTAAHCVYGSENYPNSFSVQYGVLEINNNENVVGVSKIVSHPQYINGYNYANDVAVVTLSSPITMSASATPTVLPAQDDPTPGDEAATLSGWGYPYSGGSVMTHLQTVQIICYNDVDCETAHSGQTSRNYHVCAGVPEGGKGQCSGDSGGPLVVDGVQVGVVSWSVKPCTIAGYPGVFAKVASYVDWIKSQM